MRDFFHADTSVYKRRFKSLTITVLVPLFTTCIFCVVNIFLNLRSGSREFVMLMLAIISGCVFTGLVFEFAALYFTEKLTRRHNRFTYFDILPKGMIYSVYAGEYIMYGKRVIMRRLYYMPFAGVTEILRDPKTNPHALTIKGDVRMFYLPSNELGYHINEEGELLFDHWELNDRGFTQLNALEIKKGFGSTRAIERSAKFYLEQFRNIPEKKPFNISDHIKIKHKKKPTTSNPLLEAKSYDRHW